MTANQISYAKLQEDTRHNLETEKVQQEQATAATRQAAVREGEFALSQSLVPLQQYQAETQRISAAAAATNANANVYSAHEQARHYTVVEEETQRHNQSTEVNERVNTGAYLIGKVIDGVVSIFKGRGS